MLFQPAGALAHGGLTFGVLVVILVGKPRAARAIVLLLRQPLRTALTAAVALA